MTVNISYIQLKGKITDNYTKTLSGWKNKEVAWDNIHIPMSSSKVQYSPYAWKSGIKSGKNLDRSKQNCIVLDYDDGVTIETMSNQLRNYKFIITTTKSNMIEKKGLVCERFRVLIPAIHVCMDDDIYFRALELMFPLSDKQVLIKTGSFLGNDNAIVVRNNGIPIDMVNANRLAEKQLEEERVSKIAIDKDLLPSYVGTSARDILDRLDFNTSREILTDNGIEVIGNKFSIRDERTKSCTLYQNSAYDFGSSTSYSIFDVLMETNGIDFKDSLRIVNNYI